MPSEQKTLLIVDDDPGIQKQLRWAFDEYHALTAGDRSQAIEISRRERPSVVLLDLSMPPDLSGPSEGFAALEALLAHDPMIRIIVATGNDERENAVRAISLGAYDFIGKPVDLELLRLIVDRAFNLYDLEFENNRLRAINQDAALANVITADPQMLKICQAISQVASANISVLLTGESGTGKEVLAKALHLESSRKDHAFIPINCAAIPENLLESELFGHEKGAFTGAVSQTKGRFEHADQGTLFLDEIAEMPASLQAKLLRFLQERTIERVGGRKTIELDVRVVSATNRDLTEEISAGRFREDLFYRLNEVSFELPPLRARHGDAVLLARHFIRKFNKTLGTKIKELAPGAGAAIEAHDWPGNIRELENRLKRAMVLSADRYVSAENLDLPLPDQSLSFPTLREAREQAESETILRALSIAQNNVTQAAKLLGISRPTLYELMKGHGLKA